MKIIKNILIWLGIIICGLLSFGSLLVLLESFDLIFLSLFLAFTLWTLLLIGLISKPSTILYKFSYIKKWLGWIGIGIIVFGVLFEPGCKHDWYEIETKPASCTSVEIGKYKCSKCEEIETRKGEKFLNHRWEKTDEILPTCINNGKIIYTCSLCQKNKEEVIEFDTSLHSYILEKETQPTFLERGHRLFKCEICNEQFGEFFDLIKAPITFEIKNYEKDFLGGITLNVSVTNNTDAIIKYVEYRIYFLNNVGDIIYSDLDFIRNSSTCWKITGPIDPGQTLTFSGHGFYNNNFNGSYIIDKLVITYINDDIQYISNENFELYTNNLIK